MRLSTKAQYAVRAMVDISLHSRGNPVSLREIAQREHIPLNYLEQLFFRLKNGGIVVSVRGPAGGYLLARSSGQIKVGDIVTTVEEPLDPIPCMDKGGAVCTKPSRCLTHNIWKGLGDNIREFLDAVTLADLTREAEAAALPANSNPVLDTR